jgi:hypothetical protein
VLLPKVAVEIPERPDPPGIGVSESFSNRPECGFALLLGLVLILPIGERIV